MKIKVELYKIVTQPAKLARMKFLANSFSPPVAHKLLRIEKIIRLEAGTAEESIIALAEEYNALENDTIMFDKDETGELREKYEELIESIIEIEIEKVTLAEINEAKVSALDMEFVDFMIDFDKKE